MQYLIPINPQRQSYFGCPVRIMRACTPVQSIQKRGPPDPHAQPHTVYGLLLGAVNLCKLLLIIQLWSRSAVCFEHLLLFPRRLAYTSIQMSDSESENEVIELGEEDSGEEESNEDSGDDSEGAGPTMKDLYEGKVVI